MKSWHRGPVSASARRVGPSVGSSLTILCKLEVIRLDEETALKAVGFNRLVGSSPTASAMSEIKFYRQDNQVTASIIIEREQFTAVGRTEDEAK